MMSPTGRRRAHAKSSVMLAGRWVTAALFESSKGCGLVFASPLRVVSEAIAFEGADEAA
jgi:hypothetical protein